MRKPARNARAWAFEEVRIHGYIHPAATFYPAGQTFCPDGQTFRPAGETFRPAGETFCPAGETFYPDGQTFYSDGRADSITDPLTRQSLDKISGLLPKSIDNLARDHRDRLFFIGVVFGIDDEHELQAVGCLDIRRVVARFACPTSL